MQTFTYVVAGLIFAGLAVAVFVIVRKIFRDADVRALLPKYAPVPPKEILRSQGLTTDRADPELRETLPNGQQKKYLVLSDAERAKGFVRPVRRSYIHAKCGTLTKMGIALAETYARDPDFYGATFCCGCGKHYPLIADDGKPAFVWEDGKAVGA